ncbi:hypothetical protein [Serratia fonticola]|uniref:Uncharacterized protein n=1 Tax=Serratia fonticola TaxID=47917 RepID=A0ABY9PQT5_SERFO|nr:hypothetical protein [Serratia fonticola]WMT14894.1 hypothetical protein RFB13_00610 [Serratia fonticola]
MSGIRITQAIDYNQALIDVIAFNPRINPYPLTCPDQNCSAHLVYVKSYIRRSYGKTQHIPAFFRLGKGYLHNEFCQYGTSGLDTIHAGDSSHDIRRALARGNNIFRLHILDADDITQIRRKAAAMQAHPLSDTTDRVYVRKGRKDPYVKNMLSLREIYDYGKANPHLKNTIKIVTGTTTVAWSDFFYETSQLDQLSTYLQTVKTAQVAVIMKVHVVRTPIAQFGNKQFIEGSPKKIMGKPDLYPTIQLGNVTPKLFPLSRNVMILGKFSVPVPNKMIMNPIIEREVRTIVFSEEQVLIV